MAPLWIWLGALGFYALFSFWYVNWSGPLTLEEVDGFMDRLEARAEEATPERLAVVRRFLENDDGKEFFMANLVRLPKEPVADPNTGELRPAPEVLREYTGPFMRKLFGRAGHPAFFARAAGGYVEHWGVEADPGWSFVGMVRYRSRRDMAELAAHPSFGPIHAYKLVAMTHTLAFPATPGMAFFGPRVWLALLLGLVAAIVHILFGARG